MLHANHIRFALAGWLATATLTSTAVTPLNAGLAVIGALAPDLDHPSSLFGQRVPWFGRTVRRFSQHRGITHSALALTLCALPAFIYNPCFPYAVGYATGLFGDWLTQGGIQWAWPSRRWYKAPRYIRWTTGNWRETAYTYSALLLAVYYWTAWQTPWVNFTEMLHGRGSPIDTARAAPRALDTGAGGEVERLPAVRPLSSLYVSRQPDGLQEPSRPHRDGGGLALRVRRLHPGVGTPRHD